MAFDIFTFGFQLEASDGGPGFCYRGCAPGHQDLELWEDHLVLLAHGGRGSGKTKAGAIRTLLYLLTWPGCLGIVTAPTIWMIHDSTWPKLEETFTSVGLKPGRDYIYNRDREEIDFKLTGSKLLLRSTEHPDRLRGQDAAFFWMDEPRDSPFEAFTNLMGTRRQPGYPHQGWLTTTPNGRRSWLCKVFYPQRAVYMPGEAQISTDGVGTFVPYPALTRDNPFGGAALYREVVQVMGENSLLARQELRGEFVLIDGLVYDNWDPDYHCKKREVWPEIPDWYLGGIDFGFTNPAAIVVEGVDHKARRYIVEEFYKRRCSEYQLAEECWRLLNKYDIYRFEADPADPRWISALRSAGLPVVGARKGRIGTTRDISSGLGLCYAALGQPGLEDQRFFVDAEACPYFCNEIESYTYDLDMRPSTKAHNDPERGLVFANHAMDAWRNNEIGIAHYKIRPQLVDPKGNPIGTATSIPIKFDE